MKTHKDLQIWQQGIDLVEVIYQKTGTFPSSEQFGLTSQMRRAAVSIPSNIAEGAARQGEKEYVQFLYIALGSLAELETQAIIAKRLGYFEELQTFEIIESLRRKMINFINFRKSSRLRKVKE